MKAQTAALGALDKLSVAQLRSLKVRGFSDRQAVLFPSLYTSRVLSLTLSVCLCVCVSVSVNADKWLATAGRRSWWCGGADSS